MSAPRGGTGYSVFISSLSMTSLVCEANEWPHLQGLSVSFITVTRVYCNAARTRPGREYIYTVTCSLREGLGVKLGFIFECRNPHLNLKP
jgi:hypothetical protein